jgi:hypothetical protein
MSKKIISVCLEEDFIKEIDFAKGREKRSTYLRYLIQLAYGVDKTLRANGIPPEQLVAYLRDMKKK